MFFFMSKVFHQKFALDYLNILFFDSVNFLFIFLIAKLTTIIKILLVILKLNILIIGEIIFLEFLKNNHILRKI